MSPNETGGCDSNNTRYGGKKKSQNECGEARGGAYNEERTLQRGWEGEKSGTQLWECCAQLLMPGEKESPTERNQTDRGFAGEGRHLEAWG